MDRRRPPSTPTWRPTHWRATWWTGPDAGAVAVLGRGAHVVGRAPDSTPACDAPGVEPHHLRIAVDDDGSITLVQLTGRTAIRVDGRAIGVATTATSFTWVECGGGLLALHPEPVVTPRPLANVRRGAVVRSPRVRQARPIVGVPEPPPAPPLDPATTIGGLAAALVLTVVTGNPLMLVMGLTGVIAPRLIGGWRRRSAHRRRRRATIGRLDAERAWHHAHLPTVVAALDTLRTGDDRLWARRTADGDAHLVTLGLGAVRVGDAAPGAVDDTLVIDGVPVPFDLGPGARLAVSGPHDVAVAHALLVQLLATTGPADLRVALCTDHPERWRALHALPHVVEFDDVIADAIEGHGSADGVHTLVVTDRPSPLTERTSPLRGLLAARPRTALLAIVGTSSTPRVCTHSLHTRPDGTATLVGDSTTLGPIRFAGVHPDRARRSLAALRGLRDPEVVEMATTRLPDDVELTTLLTTDPDAIARRWSATRTPMAIIGCRPPTGDRDPDPYTLDLVGDGPHALIAGTTGSGKSELLRTLVLGLALASPPHRLAFVLVDYKGGAAFDAVRALPHVVGVVTDLDDDLVDRTLRSLHAELRRREHVLRDHRCTDLGDLHDRHPTVVLPRLVVAIDEFATLVAEQPTFLHALVGVAQRGRSLGVHLVLATQRPQGVVSDDIRANTDLRIALRLQHTDESRDVIGTIDACGLPRRTPGRALVRIGAEEPLAIQTARCADPAAVISAIAAVTATLEVPLPRAPWCPPLPGELHHVDLPPGAVGLLDLPDQQQVRGLHWTPADGGVLVGAVARSGGTTALQGLAGRALADGHRVYVVDAGDDPGWTAWTAHPSCGGVVTVHDHERLWRLLHHCSTTACVLVVDRLDTVRMLLDDPTTLAAASALDRLLTASHVTPVATLTDLHTLPLRLGSRIAHRWRLTGEGRVVLDDGTVGRMALDPVPPASTGGERAPTVEPVAAHVGREALGVATAGRLPIGLGVPSGAPVVLDLRPGDHLLVVGGPRTGRSTALRTLAAAWRDAHPDDPLVVVDDADEVDDADGSLADLLRTGRTTVLAAARPDALRSQYGHWTALVRRGRRGLVAAGGSDLDGDLLGQVLPRTLPAEPRPGLMWLVVNGTASLVQVAQG